MNVLQNLHITDLLHSLSQGLIGPTIILLLVFAAFSVYTLGSFVVEYITERRHYQLALPELISAIDEAEFADLPKVIDNGQLLDTQHDSLLRLVSFAYLPEDAYTEVAKRLLLAESERYDKSLAWTDAAAKVAPMLGLMGTIIPLGTGIVGLSSGDLATLSTSLLTAFDTTVAGLMVAVICVLVSRARRRWYRGYLTSLEGAMNTILEKVRDLRDQGYRFERPADAGALPDYPGARRRGGRHD